MLFIGSIIVDTTGTDSIQSSGVFEMPERYGVLVMWNDTAAETMSATRHRLVALGAGDPPALRDGSRMGGRLSEEHPEIGLTDLVGAKGSYILGRMVQVRTPATLARAETPFVLGACCASLRVLFLAESSSRGRAA